MNKVVKKSIAMLISLTFIFLAMTSTTAIDVQQYTSNSENSDEQLTTTSEKVTLYKHGPDGSITPIEVEINLEDGQDIQEAIEAKCKKILEEDKEIQEGVKALSDFTLGAVVYVQSSGKGFHYQSKLVEKLALRFWLWKLVLPRIALFIAKPVVFCKYAADPNAYTYYKTIAPSKLISPYLGDLNELFWRQNRTVTVTGNHSVAVNSFIGITTWAGRFSFTPLNLRAKSFFGYGRFVITNKLK